MCLPQKDILNLVYICESVGLQTVADYWHQVRCWAGGSVWCLPLTHHAHRLATSRLVCGTLFALCYTRGWCSSTPPPVLVPHPQVILMNDYQKQRFVERVISAMFNTISQKKIAVYGFAFKKVGGRGGEEGAVLWWQDLACAQTALRTSCSSARMCQPASLRCGALQDTGDTRETPAIDVCRGLMADGARVCVYDPQVEDSQIYQVSPGMGGGQN